MKVVIKNNNVFAYHYDAQDIHDIYPLYEIIQVDDSINLYDDDGKFISKSEFLSRASLVEIDCKKECKWSKVKYKRIQLYEYPISYMGHEWQMDDSSIYAITSSIRTLTDDIDTLSWRTIENVMVELTKTQLNELLVSYDNRRLSIFNASLNIKTDIDNASTVENIDALDIDALFTAYII